MKMMSLIASLALVLVTASPAAAGTGTAHYGVYANAAGLRTYKVHLPSSYRPGTPMPMLVALHGCLMSGYELNSMEATTHLSELAEERGFIVVYPTQSILSDLMNCWNWELPEHRSRDAGEPSLIAGITRQVRAQFAVDPQRVYVAGASSGAAMATIMAVTYPDLYAAVGIGAGCEYACDPALADDPDTISPEETATKAYAAMGPRARPVPALVFQGTADTVVPPLAADRLVTHWAQIDDLAIDGLDDGDVDDVPDLTERVENPGDHPYTRTVYTDRGTGATMIEKYLVDGLGHQWPKGSGLFGDPSGPDASRLLWDFLSTHRNPSAS
ncbi:PHB depolymerase family esterase [Nonomuraea sp. NPDC005650]|uniref:extracellular catalytic domain type 1 short-chain-length polyhydroxyalkanoate depolymerase n=1 Tax=Nonomuraea sp. NPDC005650 TaxID=3157045 RepID=UPI0033B63D19